MARLVLKLLGQVQITLDNQPLTGFESDKSRALLIFLATEPPRLHRRETLAALLWPNVLETSARQSLSQALSNLRKVLKEHDAENPFLTATREGVQLNPEASIASDVAVLRHVRAGNKQASLPDIVELYGGPFLEGFTLAGGDGFEEWLLLQRESLQREAIEVLDKHIEQNLKLANLVEVIRAARRQLELDPWREESHRFLMRAYALNGQRGDAIAQYEKCRKALAEELRIEPSAATRHLLEDIRAGKIVAATANREPTTSTGPAVAKAVASRPAAQPKMVGLPRTLTPFIGRAREVEALSELLISPETRLVTVLGMGGMGKTRLSIQAATQVLNHFENGVVFVPLAAVNNAEQMAVAIITALGASANQQHDWPALMDNLTHTLGEKHSLLILDNLEHLLATSPDTDLVVQIIIKILAAPKAKLLVTSREALKLQSEWVISLDGFDDRHMADAISLFLQSAGHAQAQFQERAEDAPRIRRICQLVDGMPLGIELAASWINLLSLDEIGHEIEHSLEMLTTRMRDVPQRHRSITAVMDHSWQLLTVEEQRVMARLAVFRGSFTREMARQVADASLTTLAQLVSKSMLRRSDQNRYELHELMRQYAQAQLEQSGQMQAVQSRHATAFLAYIEANDRQLHGAESASLKQKLAVDLGNFRAAYQWASSSSDPILALKLAAALVRLYYLLPNWSEGNDMLVNARAKAQASVPDKARIEPVTLGRVELGLAVFQHTWGHYAAAVQYLEAALAQFRTQPDQWYVAWTLSMLGQCFLAMNDVAACETVVDESHDLFQILGDRWAIGFTTWQKAHVARARADDAQAIQLAQISLTQFRALNDVGCLALVHNLLGEMAIHHRDFAAAVRHYSDSIGVLRNTNNPAGLAWTQLCLGQALLGNGQSDQAIPCFIESALLREAMGDAETLNEALQGLAICMAEQGNFVLAAQLFGAAARGWRGESFILQPAMFERFEQARNLARSQLGERRWQAEHTLGKLTAPHVLIESAEAWVQVPVA